MWDLQNMVQDSTFSLKNKDILKLQNNSIQFFKHTHHTHTHRQSIMKRKQTSKSDRSLAINSIYGNTCRFISKLLCLEKMGNKIFVMTTIPDLVPLHLDSKVIGVNGNYSVPFRGYD